jgi:hypothetical protein
MFWSCATEIRKIQLLYNVLVMCDELEKYRLMYDIPLMCDRRMKIIVSPNGLMHDNGTVNLVPSIVKVRIRFTAALLCFIYVSLNAKY